jgi:DNA-binding MarR family transcriptional regulator
MIAAIITILRERGITSFNQAIALEELSRESLLISELGKKVEVSTPMATGIVDRLEINGLALRVRSLSDRRKQWVQIALAGRELLERVGEVGL